MFPSDKVASILSPSGLRVLHAGSCVVFPLTPLARVWGFHCQFHVTRTFLFFTTKYEGLVSHDPNTALLKIGCSRMKDLNYKNTCKNEFCYVCVCAIVSLSDKHLGLRGLFVSQWVLVTRITPLPAKPPPPHVTTVTNANCNPWTSQAEDVFQ